MLLWIPTLVLIFSLSLSSKAQTGSSYCNAGTCSLDAQCDLGVCCTANGTAVLPGQIGTCLSIDTSTYPSGASCDISNPCMRCPEGEVCVEGKCVAKEVKECKLDYGCPCNEHSLCSSNYCAPDGICRHKGLSHNDRCVAGEQCFSRNCSLGKCVGLPLGAPCDEGTDPCTYGARCQLGDEGYTCTLMKKSGESCNCTADCDYYMSACINGKCGDAKSLNEGDDCNRSFQCKMHLLCNNGKCERAPSGNCVDTSCPPLYQCECDDDKGTTCKQVRNSCHEEYTNFIACMRDNECKQLYSSETTFYTDDMCSQNCLKEAIETVCCSDCGGIAQNVITSPPYFLHCDSSSYHYTPVCNGSCGAYPLSVCSRDDFHSSEDRESTSNRASEGSQEESLSEETEYTFHTSTELMESNSASISKHFFVRVLDSIRAIV